MRALHDMRLGTSITVSPLAVSVNWQDRHILSSPKFLSSTGEVLSMNDSKDCSSPTSSGFQRFNRPSSVKVTIPVPKRLMSRLKIYQEITIVFVPHLCRIAKKKVDDI